MKKYEYCQVVFENTITDEEALFLKQSFAKVFTNSGECKKTCKLSELPNLFNKLGLEGWEMKDKIELEPYDAQNMTHLNFCREKK